MNEQGQKHVTSYIQVGVSASVLVKIIFYAYEILPTFNTSQVCVECMNDPGLVAWLDLGRHECVSIQF